MDISNGEGIGVSLFVQGCHFHCNGCFNIETWDFNGGKEWTKEVENEFINLIDRPYIKRVSVLGGEPLADENVRKIYLLTKKIKALYPDKKIWLYSGYTYEQLIDKDLFGLLKGTQSDDYRRLILHENVDILVDGLFENDKKDLSLKFRGSSNQRVIDVKKSLENGDTILWEVNVDIN